MKQQTVVVGCPHGVHVRIAAKAVRLAHGFDSAITVRCGNCPKANACSVLELLALGAQQGMTLSIEAEGEDEGRAVDAMVDLFESGGGI
jgi:phosphotransferase system HPr (HPr) family protein